MNIQTTNRLLQTSNIVAVSTREAAGLRVLTHQAGDHVGQCQGHQCVSVAHIFPVRPPAVNAIMCVLSAFRCVFLPSLQLFMRRILN